MFESLLKLDPGHYNVVKTVLSLLSCEISPCSVFKKMLYFISLQDLARRVTTAQSGLVPGLR